jgi:hypothetical protein
MVLRHHNVAVALLNLIIHLERVLDRLLLSEEFLSLERGYAARALKIVSR